MASKNPRDAHIQYPRASGFDCVSSESEYRRKQHGNTSNHDRLERYTRYRHGTKSASRQTSSPDRRLSSSGRSFDEQRNGISRSRSKSIPYARRGSSSWNYWENKRESDKMRICKDDNIHRSERKDVFRGKLSSRRSLGKRYEAYRRSNSLTYPKSRSAHSRRIPYEQSDIEIRSSGRRFSRRFANDGMDLNTGAGFRRECQRCKTRHEVNYSEREFANDFSRRGFISNESDLSRGLGHLLLLASAVSQLPSGYMQVPPMFGNSGPVVTDLPNLMQNQTRYPAQTPSVMETSTGYELARYGIYKNESPEREHTNRTRSSSLTRMTQFRNSRSPSRTHSRATWPLVGRKGRRLRQPSYRWRMREIAKPERREQTDSSRSSLERYRYKSRSVSAESGSPSRERRRTSAIGKIKDSNQDFSRSFNQKSDVSEVISISSGSSTNGASTDASLIVSSFDSPKNRRSPREFYRKDESKDGSLISDGRSDRSYLARRRSGLKTPKSPALWRKPVESPSAPFTSKFRDAKTSTLLDSSKAFEWSSRSRNEPISRTSDKKVQQKKQGSYPMAILKGAPPRVIDCEPRLTSTPGSSEELSQELPEVHKNLSPIAVLSRDSTPKQVSAQDVVNQSVSQANLIGSIEHLRTERQTSLNENPEHACQGKSCGEIPSRGTASDAPSTGIIITPVKLSRSQSLSTVLESVARSEKFAANSQRNRSESPTASSERANIESVVDNDSVSPVLPSFATGSLMASQIQRRQVVVTTVNRSSAYGSQKEMDDGLQQQTLHEAKSGENTSNSLGSAEYAASDDLSNVFPNASEIKIEPVEDKFNILSVTSLQNNKLVERNGMASSLDQAEEVHQQNESFKSESGKMVKIEILSEDEFPVWENQNLGAHIAETGDVMEISSDMPHLQAETSNADQVTNISQESRNTIETPSNNAADKTRTRPRRRRKKPVTRTRPWYARVMRKARRRTVVLYKCPFTSCHFVSLSRRNLLLHNEKYHATDLPEASKSAHSSARANTEENTWKTLQNKRLNVNEAQSAIGTIVEKKRDETNPEKQATRPKMTARNPLRVKLTPASKYSCKVCGKTFKTSIARREHEYIHSGEKPYKCAHCSYATRCHANLFSHMKQHEPNSASKCECVMCTDLNTASSSIKTATNQDVPKAASTSKPKKTGKVKQKPGSVETTPAVHIDKARRNLSSEFQVWKCKFCTKTFTSKTETERHALVHSTSKPYECRYCGHRVKEKQHLKMHEMLHTRDEAFKCSVCGVSFRSSAALKVHVSRMHLNRQTKERKSDNIASHKCKYCDASFRKKTTLWTHVKKIHGSVGSTSAGQDRHGTTSTKVPNVARSSKPGLKPRNFVCIYCSKACKARHSLENHERTHTGEKPFHCRYCSYRSAQKVNVKSHEKKVHLSRDTQLHCPLCDFTCQDKLSLAIHVRKHDDCVTGKDETQR